MDDNIKIICQKLLADTIITKEEFIELTKVLTDYGYSFDYLIRCYTTGDGEVSQLENKFFMYFTSIPKEARDKLPELIKDEIVKNDYSYIDWIIKNYKESITLWELYEKDYALWENIMFSDIEDMDGIEQSYIDYIDDLEDRLTTKGN